MAPRRGGGGGGGSSSDISCDSDAFSSDASRIDIAFHSLFALVSLILYTLAHRRFKRGKRDGFPVKGRHLLVLSILFALFYHIITIVVIAMAECSPSSYSDSWPATVAGTWLREISMYIIIFVLLVTISKKFYTQFGTVQTQPLTIQTAWAVLVAILLAAGLAIETVAFDAANNADSYSDYDLLEKLFNPQRGVWTTYAVVSVVGVLIAAATVSGALRGAQGSLNAKSLTRWTYTLILAALGSTLTSLGTYVDRAFSTAGSLSELQDKAHATLFILSFFYLLAFYAAVQVLAYRGGGLPGATQQTAFVQPGPAGHGGLASEPGFRYESGYYHGERGAGNVR
ncbi:hypothetical protein BJX70DRAFT_397302 [Aspergillus crustosus]